MLFRLITLAVLLSLAPSLAGAQELGTLRDPGTVEERTVQPLSSVNLMPTQDVEGRLVVAVNDLQANPAPEERQARETRPSCSFGNFVDVHFGGYRWIYWAVAGAILVAIHAN